MINRRVGWQVALCCFIWLVTLRSSEMDFLWRTIPFNHFTVCRSSAGLLLPRRRRASLGSRASSSSADRWRLLWRRQWRHCRLWATGVCLFVSLCVCLYVCVSAYVSVTLSVSVSAYLSVRLSVVQQIIDVFVTQTITSLSSADSEL